MKKNFHKITDAYDAFWFIYHHPDCVIAERGPRLDESDALQMRAEGYNITEFECEDGSIFYQQEQHFTHHALDENLHIYYALVDGNGNINDNPDKNVNTECWLEFGGFGWTKSYRDLWIDEPHLQTYHDHNLDCGAPTFDEAFVILAKRIKKFYGDYDPYKPKNCKCPDCKRKK